MLHSYTSWSFWSGCPARFDYQYNQRLPQGPTPPHFIHGRAVHKNVEDVLKKRVKSAWYESQPDHIQQFLDRIVKSDDYVVENRVETDIDWNVAPTKPDAYAVFKMDVAFSEDNKSVHIVDWKTGKGQLSKYVPQGTAYAAAASAAWPNRTVTVHFVNLDQGKIGAPNGYTVAQCANLRTMWSQNFGLVDRARVEQDWRPTPDRFLCKWCPYGKSKGGPCQAEEI